MRTIIFTKLDKIDFTTSTINATIVESTDQLIEENGVFLLEDTEINAFSNDTDKVFIPSTLMEATNENVHVYFELEQYPFFQKAKEVIANPKGVLRFRRMLPVIQAERLIASDLVVFSELLGEPLDVQVKQTNPIVKPNHTIVTAKFDNGTMAHMEYTVSDLNKEEQIEFEWSGIKQIIEFNSEEMKPIHPRRYTKLPLTYSVDSILATARKANQDLLNRLEKFTLVLSGGVAK
ncbi:hypothetical protein CV093_18370 [Oceanobacillus sp. 143]|uniref:Uncharacterized protein n=1 Tax=Oceanobacillus zhaokaii TaxID=2052660 RepID=A0A345PKL7_9BACI|nr:hypothetical protein [Oceanobacillus zhaokaii]AXI10547.1 hypothetical protein CUC15_17095 [Oceanobacillus zhaokaii]QGS69528.1 hypothetical protein CV093_18370 [Oceanobacillus sp. 143]